MAASAASKIDMATRDGGADVLDSPDVIEKTKGKFEPRKASMYKVIIHNDDITPIPYVEKLLKEVFNRTRQDARALTSAVHEQGGCVAGVFAKAVAEAKLEEAEAHKDTYRPSNAERRAGCPERVALRLTMEKE